MLFIYLSTYSRSSLFIYLYIPLCVCVFKTHSNFISLASLTLKQNCTYLALFCSWPQALTAPPVVLCVAQHPPLSHITYHWRIVRQTMLQDCDL